MHVWDKKCKFETRNASLRREMQVQGVKCKLEDLGRKCKFRERNASSGWKMQVCQRHLCGRVTESILFMCTLH